MQYTARHLVLCLPVSSGLILPYKYSELRQAAEFAADPKLQLAQYLQYCMYIGHLWRRHGINNVEFVVSPATDLDCPTHTFQVIWLV